MKFYTRIVCILLLFFPFIGTSQIYLYNQELYHDLQGICVVSLAEGEQGNADGIIDIVAVGLQRSFNIYQNDGAGNLTLQFSIPGGMVWGQIDLGDIDNDGLLDLLVSADSDQSYGGGKILIYKQNPDGTFSKVLEMPGFDFSSAKFADVDNDGELDFIAAGYTGPFYSPTGAYNDYGTVVYKNIGNGNFSLLDVPMTGATGLSACSMIVGRLNSDQWIDFVISGYTKTGESCLKAYQNDGTGHFILIQNIPENINTGFRYGGLSAIKGTDGVITYLAATGVDKLGFSHTGIYLNNGSGTFSFAYNPFIAAWNVRGFAGGPDSVALADLHQDGQFDLAVMGVDQQNRPILLIRNNVIGNQGATGDDYPTLTAPELYPTLPDTGFSHGAVIFGNLDPDPDLEMIAGGGINDLYVSRVLTFDYDLHSKAMEVALAAREFGPTKYWVNLYNYGAASKGNELRNIIISCTFPAELEFQNCILFKSSYSYTYEIATRTVRISVPGPLVGGFNWTIGWINATYAPGVRPNQQICVHFSEDYDNRPPLDTPDNENFTICSRAVISWDPNSKTVTPDGLISNDDTLNYIINYENEGNGPAGNIVISDKISEDLNLYSVSISDPNASIDYQNRTINWTLNNVQLPPRGTGSVSFNIKPNTFLPVGFRITNRASIVFDNNFPIQTDPAVVIIGPGSIALETLSLLFQVKLQLDFNTPNGVNGLYQKIETIADDITESQSLISSGNNKLAIQRLENSLNNLNSLTKQLLACQNSISIHHWPIIQDDLAQITENINTMIDLLTTSLITTVSPKENISDGVGVVVKNNKISRRSEDSITLLINYTSGDSFEFNIYDLSGEKIDSPVPTISQGIATVSWSGKNSQNQDVAPGVYLISIVKNKTPVQTVKVLFTP